MKCNVCDSSDHKYKCPKCRIPYCSLVCWRIHKSKSCEVSSTSPVVHTADEAFVNMEIKNDLQYKFPTEDTVPIEKLKLLESNKNLLQVLENPHVRDILNMIDRSPNPEGAMHSAMLEPIFVEFADECFRVIEAPEN